MVPAEGGQKILKLKSSWRRSKILAASLKHWKGRWGGLGWVGSRPHPDLRDHGRRPSLRVTTGPAGSRLSGLKAYRTDDRPRTPRWHTREGDAAVPVCMGCARCLCVWGACWRGREACRVTRGRWGGRGVQGATSRSQSALVLVCRCRKGPGGGANPPPTVYGRSDTSLPLPLSRPRHAPTQHGPPKGLGLDSGFRAAEGSAGGSHSLESGAGDGGQRLGNPRRSGGAQGGGTVCHGPGTEGCSMAKKKITYVGGLGR